MRQPHGKHGGSFRRRQVMIFPPNPSGGDHKLHRLLQYNRSDRLTTRWFCAMMQKKRMAIQKRDGEKNEIFDRISSCRWRYRRSRCGAPSGGMIGGRWTGTNKPLRQSQNWRRGSFLCLTDPAGNLPAAPDPTGASWSDTCRGCRGKHGTRHKCPAHFRRSPRDGWACRFFPSAR